jgi:lipase
VGPSPLFVTVFNPGQRPLLALHGIDAHGLRYLRLAAMLPELSVVAPDLRGHGRSPNDGPWTVAQHVADLLPLLEPASGANFVLGHSFGGLLAWELARAAPALIDGLILVDPAIGVPVVHARAEQAQAMEPERWPDCQAALASMIVDRSPAAHWAQALDAAIGVERDADGWLRPMSVPDAIRAGWEEMLAPLRSSAYRGPTLLIEAGRENGLFVSAALVDALRGQLGDQLEHVVFDAPHTIPADCSDQLAQRVGEFVGR